MQSTTPLRGLQLQSRPAGATQNDAAILYVDYVYPDIASVFASGYIGIPGAIPVVAADYWRPADTVSAGIDGAPWLWRGVTDTGLPAVNVIVGGLLVEDNQFVSVPLLTEIIYAENDADGSGRSSLNVRNTVTELDPFSLSGTYRGGWSWTDAIGNPVIDGSFDADTDAIVLQFNASMASNALVLSNVADFGAGLFTLFAGLPGLELNEIQETGVANTKTAYISEIMFLERIDDQAAPGSTRRVSIDGWDGNPWWTVLTDSGGGESNVWTVGALPLISYEQNNQPDEHLDLGAGLVEFHYDAASGVADMSYLGQLILFQHKGSAGAAPAGSTSGAGWADLAVDFESWSLPYNDGTFRINLNLSLSTDTAGDRVAVGVRVKDQGGATIDEVTLIEHTLPTTDRTILPAVFTYPTPIADTIGSFDLIWQVLAGAGTITTDGDDWLSYSIEWRRPEGMT